MSETNSANAHQSATRGPADAAHQTRRRRGARPGGGGRRGTARPLAQQQEKIPDFSLDNKSAWLMISDNLAATRQRSWPGDF